MKCFSVPGPALAVLLGVCCTCQAQPDGRGFPHRNQFGMNLSGVIDWTREWPLVDVFKPSRRWITKGPGEFAFDAQGNPLLQPGQAVETLMVREINGHYPGGRYVATWEGTGTVAMTRWDVRKVVSTAPHRLELEVVPGDGGIQVEITASDPKDPIRNIHCWMPGFEKARSPFHPLFVERLQPFSVIRFMDWQQTNNSPVRTWGERAKLTDARYSTEAGMPPVLLIELANTLKADPWFCMPHLADDDFVQRFAMLVKEKLAPDRRIYLEYSNEVWNSQFKQANHARERGLAMGLSSNDYQAQLRFYSQRAVEMFRIWEQVFGGRKQLVRVLAAQAANPWTSEQVLGWKDAWKQADALAVAPYFGNAFGDPKTQERVAKLPVTTLLSELKKEIDSSNKEMIARQSAVARKANLQLIAYEGGQHLAGYAGTENNEALTNLFIAANRHPGMHDLYRAHLRNWFQSGGGLFVVFSNVSKPSKWGSWGALEYQDQPVEQAPKYRAILEAVRTP